MQRQWVTNVDRSRAITLRDGLESRSGSVCLIGRPLADGPCSVTELEVMNLVGIYMEVSDDELKPDPNCPECKDAGVIRLFTSSSPCGCLKRGVDLDDDFPGYDEGNWE